MHLLSRHLLILIAATSLAAPAFAQDEEDTAVVAVRRVPQKKWASQLGSRGRTVFYLDAIEVQVDTHGLSRRAQKTRLW